MKVIKKGLKGFTLIEFVIAMAIMAEAVLVSTDIFNNLLKLQRRSQIIYNSQEDARFVLEKLSQELRLGTIDYIRQTVFRGTSSLYLLNSSNESVDFVWQNNKLYLAKSGQFGLTNITPQNLKITNLAFYVAPEQDPLTMITPMQPRITLTMTVTQADDKKAVEERVTLNIETTISSRVYKQ